MKNIIKYILQKILGLNNYLYLFARFMIYKLPWDRKEKDFLRFLDLIEDGGHVLDIGANIGVMTFHFSKKLKKSVVHSFEPVPVNFMILERIVRNYKLWNVKTYSFALGESKREVKMIMPQSNHVYFHGLSHVERTKTDDKGKVYQVRMEKLDDVDELKNVKIRAIKIDVEDYEYFVLKGGEQIIQKNRPLIYTELWESENKSKCFEFLKKNNFYVFINKKGRITEFNGEMGFQNFFFIPEECCDAIPKL